MTSAIHHTPDPHTEEMAERLDELEETVEKTYRIVHAQMIWRWVYWGIILLIVVSGYIYLGPIVESLIGYAKPFILFSGS